MRNCPNCGRSIEDESYCKFCGTSITPASNTNNPRSELRMIVENRLNAIKTRDEATIDGIMDRGSYTKFDDWPPFNLQDSTEASENERGAYKALQKYDYEIQKYEERQLDNVGLATFQIHYWGTIRDRNFDMNSRVTIVFKKLDQNWRVVHEHWSRFPEERRRSLF